MGDHSHGTHSVLVHTYTRMHMLPQTESTAESWVFDSRANKAIRKGFFFFFFFVIVMLPHQWEFRPERLHFRACTNNMVSYNRAIGNEVNVFLQVIIFKKYFSAATRVHRSSLNVLKVCFFKIIYSCTQAIYPFHSGHETTGKQV